jgi:hypothetical protein
MHVETSASCDGNTVTVTEKDANGDPVEGVSVMILRDLYPGSLYLGKTDKEGEFKFNEIGDPVEVKVYNLKSGGVCYNAPGKIDFVIKKASECAVCGDGIKEATEECEKDADCAENYTCESCKCVPKTPPPKPEPPKPDCETNTDCSDSEYCSGGKCIEASGTCGFAANHTWNNYECCTDGDCVAAYGTGYICESHVCVEIEYDLSGSGGLVGGSGSAAAFEDGSAYADKELRITKPDGSVEIIKTDSDGKLNFALLQAGNYTIDLLVNGTVKKSITVTSLPKTPTEPTTPTFFDVLAQNSVLLLVLLVILVAAFWILRKPGKPKPVRKKPGRLK